MYLSFKKQMLETIKLCQALEKMHVSNSYFYDTSYCDTSESFYSLTLKYIYSPTPSKEHHDKGFLQVRQWMLICALLKTKINSFF